MGGLDFNLWMLGEQRECSRRRVGGSPMNKVLEIAKCGNLSKEWFCLVGIYGLMVCLPNQRKKKQPLFCLTLVLTVVSQMIKNPPAM